MMIRTTWMLALSVWTLGVCGQYTLTGTVRDENLHSLPGANLLITEQGKGSVSGEDGAFRIENVEEGACSLKVSYVGYRDRELRLVVKGDMELGRILLEQEPMMVEEVMVTGTRAGEKTPVAFVQMDRKEITARNFGQDVPYLLSMTPSLVTSSDAGHGIGYTSMRIRGTDANRINVTVNGIPLNDAESHSVFWVDLPDLATSVDNIQIQRGVGTSTNGASAFGASVNLMTRRVEKEAYAGYEGTLGSFGTYRNAVSAGTGLLRDRFAVDLRLSDMHSDGYIDRSWTDLRSYYASASYFDSRTLVKFITFSGMEELYQAWNGVPSYLLESDRTYNELGAYTDTSGQLSYYDNQIDHYVQNHYQLHLTHEFNEKWHVSSALHFTGGTGYYEQYREGETLSDYQLESVVIGGDTLTESDLIRRKWLDNDFYGLVGSLQYRGQGVQAILGGGWNRYEGDHFGTVIWARYAGESEIRHRWYENRGDKRDWNTYLKTTLLTGERLSLFADLQLRGIRYEISGIDDDLRDIGQEHRYLFFNPKAGLNFQADSRNRAYFFVARANREPNRSNFVDADPAGPLPVHESLLDYEAGYTFSSGSLQVNANLYFMDYTNQLVLTGEINDVGAAVMTNVRDSYRAGIEVSGGARLTTWLRWDANATLSENKVLDYVGFVDNWDYWSDPDHEPYQVVEELGTTDLSFSPGLIIKSVVDAEPLANLHLRVSSRYVGRQFIDNTSSADRVLDPYFVNDLGISYAMHPPFIKELSLQLQLLNLFNELYETNAWIYRYYSEGEQGIYDGFYPQAGFHLMAGVRIRF